MRVDAMAICSILLASGCSSGDPGEILGGPRGTMNAVGENDAATPPDGSPPSVDDVDAAVDAPMTPQDPFAGAGPYAPHPVDVSAEQEHRRRGITTLATGTECLSCHDGAKAVRFAFGGTLVAGGDGGVDGGDAGVASDVEVRVVDYRGALIGDAYTDVDGNFWFASTKSIRGWAWPGVRNATSFQKMPTSIAQGGCNTSGCHGATNRLRGP